MYSGLFGDLQFFRSFFFCICILYHARISFFYAYIFFIHYVSFHNRLTMKEKCRNIAKQMLLTTFSSIFIRYEKNSIVTK